MRLVPFFLSLLLLLKGSTKNYDLENDLIILRKHSKTEPAAVHIITELFSLGNEVQANTGRKCIKCL